MIVLKINTFVSVGMGLVVEGQRHYHQAIINILRRNLDAAAYCRIVFYLMGYQQS